jgi:hypothetical protein
VSVDTGADPVVTANDAIAPDGNLTADKVVFDLGEGASARSYLANTLTTVAGDHSLSVWLKGETGGEQIVARHVGAVAYSLFTLTTEWQRFDLVETSAGGSSSIHLGLRQGVVGTINTQATVYIWGAQLEVGAFPTSYIPTAGATATRSADVASIPVADFGYNRTNTVGTFYVSWDTFDAGEARALSVTDAGGANRAVDMFFSTATARTDVYSNHTTMGLYNLGSPASGLNKMIAAMKENDAAACTNGGTVVTDTTTTAPISADKFNMGSFGGSSHLNGHIKSIRYYPRRLTDAQLQELTT